MTYSVRNLDNGLVVLADGSLVDPSRYADRYSRPGDSAELSDWSGADLRTETERDRARIGYSPFLRRLAGVTQVVSPALTSARLHTRGSHSHKVAMVAREIAENLVRRAESNNLVADFILQHGGLDIAASEAAGLSHDIGHPPYGHAGEEQLDALLSKHGVDDGFEGNAQTFRVLVSLDRHRNVDRPGLALTNVTLAAVLKYPWLRDRESESRSRKFCVYTTEEAEFRRVHNVLAPRRADGQPDVGAQTLEASVMDLADDIAYSIHDLEDFLGQGVIDLDAAIEGMRIAAAHYQKNGEIAPTNPFVRAEKKMAAELFTRSAYGTALSDLATQLELSLGPNGAESRQQSLLELKSVLSNEVKSYFESIDAKSLGGHQVQLKPPAWHRMQVLKTITKQFLVSTSRMALIQQAQKRSMRNLFIGLKRWVRSTDDFALLPEPLNIALIDLGADAPTGEPLDKLTWKHYRAIADFICRMSDSEAARYSLWLSGNGAPELGAFEVDS